jgi:hypothetical protein
MYSSKHLVFCQEFVQAIGNVRAEHKWTQKYKVFGRTLINCPLTTFQKALKD